MITDEFFSSPPVMPAFQDALSATSAAETLRQKTLVLLREAIVTGRLGPDQRLVERDVCAQTGVSRSSVREALRYLEADGLVESRGIKGMFVVRLSADEARDIYELRMALESAAAEHFAVRATDAELAQLQEIMETIRLCFRDNLNEYWRHGDLLFDLIMRGARNDVAYRMIKTVHSRIRYFRIVTTSLADSDFRQGTVDRMAAITAALVQRDGPVAAELIRKFIARAAKLAIDSLRLRDEAPDGSTS
jgi:DNA-binding GntR family transcriptional regulator